MVAIYGVEVKETRHMKRQRRLREKHEEEESSYICAELDAVLELSFLKKRNCN